VTGRTWFIDVGELTPASLVDGYARLDVARKAPWCLAHADSAHSAVPFKRVLSSCSFTSTTRHAGNATRPWEYDERIKSLTALYSETAAYTLTQHSVADGDYFDRACFCKTFKLGSQESCVFLRLETTQQRLWMNATCGP
jgi:hypothetical protein